MLGYIMSNIWFISDTHFNHKNILSFFSTETNERVRSFNSVEEMNETLVKNWNDNIKPNDKVYHLGDVIFGKDFSILNRLNGKKRLIIGNHDDFMNKEFQFHFEKVLFWKRFKEHKFFVTHVPIFREIGDVNVHGHLHEKSDVSPFHKNISVERTNFTPLHLDDVLKRIKGII